MTQSALLSQSQSFTLCLEAPVEGVRVHGWTSGKAHSVSTVQSCLVGSWHLLHSPASS